jgi:hypothetical protein
MTVLLIILILFVAGLAGALAGLRLEFGSRWGAEARRGRPPAGQPGAERILFPFVASALSRRALDAALRLARAEEATLVPVFLARVPLHLPLDSPLPRQGALAIPLQEAIEQRAATFGVPVDSRLERGRTERHALRLTFAHERFGRIVVAAAAAGGHGFGPDDVAWLLKHAPGEIIVLRPGEEDRAVPALLSAVPAARFAGQARRRRPVGAGPS